MLLTLLANAEVCVILLSQHVGCSVLTGANTSVMEAWLWNLLNVGVALVGYHAAAFSIDWKWWGRVRMQVNHSNPLINKHYIS